MKIYKNCNNKDKIRTKKNYKILQLIFDLECNSIRRNSSFKGSVISVVP